MATFLGANNIRHDEILYDIFYISIDFCFLHPACLLLVAMELITTSQHLGHF